MAAVEVWEWNEVLTVGFLRMMNGFKRSRGSDGVGGYEKRLRGGLEQW